MKKLFLFLLLPAIMMISSCSKEDTPGSGGGGVSGPPLPASNLAVTVISSTQANLTWKDNSSDEAGFIIERKMFSNSYVIIATTAANAISYSDMGLISHTDYTYRVTPYNSSGSPGVYTNEVMITTP